MVNNPEYTLHIESDNGERDSELEKLTSKELVECIIDLTEIVGEDLTKLNTECIFRGIVIQNNGIILGIKRESTNG